MFLSFKFDFHELKLFMHATTETATTRTCSFRSKLNFQRNLISLIDQVDFTSYEDKLDLFL